ncbi:unnamed protein product [Caenorhabditis auriculariae]|uniref:Uncharacterized protein n=1 Tax=Caenorhabditis auriculariae TaxID=2777116 RepID=A0A8S1I0P8_9PELO|nr:unnamed protein product [Caenorhabditis auriculariae]
MSIQTVHGHLAPYYGDWSAFLTSQVIIVTLLHLIFIGVLIKCYPEDKKVISRRLLLTLAVVISMPVALIMVFYTVVSILSDLSPSETAHRVKKLLQNSYYV